MKVINSFTQESGQMEQIHMKRPQSCALNKVVIAKWTAKLLTIPSRSAEWSHIF